MSSRKIDIEGGLPKMGRGLGQFSDLREGGGGLARKRGGVFEGGRGVDTPIHTMKIEHIFYITKNKRQIHDWFI